MTPIRTVVMTPTGYFHSSFRPDHQRTVAEVDEKITRRCETPLTALRNGVR